MSAAANAHGHRPAGCDPLEVVFPQGLFGFQEYHRFQLSRTEVAGFYWLQSLEHPALAFALADPFLFFEHYSVELGSAEADALAARHASELAVLVTITLPSEPGTECTVNLQGPIVINASNGTGRQIVLNQPGLRTREPLPPLRAAA